MLNRLGERSQPDGKMKIICGTDFSEHAEQASLAAAAIARRLGDTLVLAHVWDKTLGEGLWHDFYDRMSAAIRNRLDDHAIRLQKTGARVEEEAPSGMADEELAKMAGRPDTRLLVVGALGRRSGEWLLGSVAEHVAVRSPIPTLVVHSAAFEAWARGERKLKIFAAFDFTGTAEAALRWVKGLLAAGPCELVVGYIDWPLAEVRRLGINGEVPLDYNPPQVQQILERELVEWTEALLGKNVARTRVEPSLGRADSRLVNMAREEQADLVIAGTHQRHGLGRVGRPSISRRLLRDAPMSVACIPAARVETIGGQSAPLRRVLAASDLSEHGSSAIPYAYGAVSPGGIVRLVHVLAPSSLLPTRSTQIVAQAEERLRAQVPADAVARGVQTEVAVIEESDVAQAIRQEAERFGAHLVCIGLHGRSGLSKTVLGGVAQNVMAQSPRPVLVVRKPSS
jgi:nucleotide-binding universal stress UspA family protein